MILFSPSLQDRGTASPRSKLRTLYASSTLALLLSPTPAVVLGASAEHDLIPAWSFRCVLYFASATLPQSACRNVINHGGPQGNGNSSAFSMADLTRLHV
jgi:hypothetical protein